MKNFIKNNWLLLLSLIYILSPIDLIPEFFVGPLGIIDDVWLVILLLIKAFISQRKTQAAQNSS